MCIAGLRKLSHPCMSVSWNSEGWSLGQCILRITHPHAQGREYRQALHFQDIDTQLQCLSL